MSLSYFYCLVWIVFQPQDELKYSKLSNLKCAQMFWLHHFDYYIRTHFYL